MFLAKSFVNSAYIPLNNIKKKILYIFTFRRVTSPFANYAICYRYLMCCDKDDISCYIDVYTVLGSYNHIPIVIYRSLVKLARACFRNHFCCFVYLWFRCGFLEVPVNWNFVVFSPCFAIFKNVVHSFEPGETPLNIAKHFKALRCSCIYSFNLLKTSRSTGILLAKFPFCPTNVSKIHRTCSTNLKELLTLMDFQIVFHSIIFIIPKAIVCLLNLILSVQELERHAYANKLDPG